MGLCRECGKRFPRLQANVCLRCQELCGKSEVEHAAILRRGQCKTCSISYRYLQTTLCEDCVRVYGLADEIPDDVKLIPGAMALIEPQRALLDAGHAILQDAAVYQASASEVRLGQTPHINAAAAPPSRPKTGPGSLQHLNQAKAVKAEQRIAKENAGKVVLDVSFSILSPTGAQARKLVPLKSRILVDETDDVRKALNDVKARMRGLWFETYPTRGRLETKQLMLFVGESRILENELIGTVHAVMKKFVGARYITQTSFDKKELSIKLVLNEDIEVEGGGAQTASARPSTAQRQSTTTSASAKRKLSGAGDINPRASRPPPAASARSSWVPRQSGLVTRSNWTRKIEMVKCFFTRLSVRVNESYVVKWDESTKVEEIEVAAEWLDGWQGTATSTEGPHTNGFIGAGESKHVIYARHQGREYALGQGKQASFSEYENEKVLMREYQLLALGEAFRTEFEGDCKKYDIPIAAFHFNYNHSILGRFVSQDGTPLESPPSNLPFRTFVATQLLPTSTMHKYTGNMDEGQRGVDPITVTLHAFAHYTYDWSFGEMVFCDLQGAQDANNIMCLIDPQAHTYETDSNQRPFWDRGPQALEHYIDHHVKASCSANPICTGLWLHEEALKKQRGAQGTGPGGESDDEAPKISHGDGFVSAGPTSRSSRSRATSRSGASGRT